jgi:membrane-associated phospholipid phosphatase
MQKKVASFISILLHPLLMPILGIITIFRSGTYISVVDPRLMNITLLIVFILTVVLPLSIIPFYFYTRLIRKIEMNRTKERLVPYFITFVFFYIAHIVIKKLPLNYFFSIYMFASSISVLIVLIISYFWKISTHMVGIGGFIGLVLSLSLRMSTNLMGILIVAIIMAGIIGYSRLELNSHSPSQVYSGFGLGLFTVSFFCLVF